MNQLKLIWFAIAFSTVVYAGIAYATNPAPEGSFEAALRDPRTLAMYFAALSAFIAGMSVPRFLQNAPAQTRMVVVMALFESCAVLGLVTAFLVHDWRVYLAPWALSLIGFIRAWPGSEATAPAA